MKRFFIILSLTLSVIIAQQAVANVAVVDIKYILDNSAAHKDLTRQVDAKRDEYQEEVTEKEEALVKKEKELRDKREVLAKDEYNKQVQSFRQGVAEAQKLVQKRRSQLEKSYVKSLEVIREKTLEIIEDLAEDGGFNVALPKAQLLYANDDLDITNKVLEKLNDELPKLRLKTE